MAWAAATLGGCASTQLNENTLNVASTTESLQTQQVLYNISKFADNADTVPDQAEISSGTIATTNSAAPSLSYSFARAAGTTSNAMVGLGTSGLRTVSKGFMIPFTDQWTQSWAIQPINDGDDLRRLRALYRYASTNALADLASYPRIMMANPNFSASDPRLSVLDPYFAQEPHTVWKSSSDKVSNELSPSTNKIDQPLPSAITPGRTLCLHVTASLTELNDESMASLGHYGTHYLYMPKSDQLKSCLSNFVLLIQDAMGATASPSSGGGKSKAGGPPVPKLAPLTAPLVVPPSVQ